MKSLSISIRPWWLWLQVNRSKWIITFSGCRRRVTHSYQAAWLKWVSDMQVHRQTCYAASSSSSSSSICCCCCCFCCCCWLWWWGGGGGRRQCHSWFSTSSTSCVLSGHAWKFVHLDRQDHHDIHGQISQTFGPQWEQPPPKSPVGSPQPVLMGFSGVDENLSTKGDAWKPWQPVSAWDLGDGGFDELVHLRHRCWRSCPLPRIL